MIVVTVAATIEGPATVIESTLFQRNGRFALGDFSVG